MASLSSESIAVCCSLRWAWLKLYRALSIVENALLEFTRLNVLVSDVGILSPPESATHVDLSLYELLDVSLTSPTVTSYFAVPAWS